MDKVKHTFELGTVDFCTMANWAIKTCKELGFESILINCREGFTVLASKESKVTDLMEIYRLNNEIMKSRNVKK